jgi:hypothetical protein
MLLNYTPVIAGLLLLVGIVGAIIGLLFFVVSDKYTLPAGPITTICISMSIMLIGIFIQEYKSRDANFSDIPNSITVSGNMVTIHNLPANYTLEPEDVKEPWHNGRDSNTYKFEYNQDFGRYTLTNLEGRTFELSDENANYIKSRQN